MGLLALNEAQLNLPHTSSSTVTQGKWGGRNVAVITGAAIIGTLALTFAVGPIGLLAFPILLGIGLCICSKFSSNAPQVVQVSKKSSKSEEFLDLIRNFTEKNYYLTKGIFREDLKTPEHQAALKLKDKKFHDVATIKFTMEEKADLNKLAEDGNQLEFNTKIKKILTQEENIENKETIKEFYKLLYLVSTHCETNSMYAPNLSIVAANAFLMPIDYNSKNSADQYTHTFCTSIGAALITAAPEIFGFDPIEAPK